MRLRKFMDVNVVCSMSFLKRLGEGVFALGWPKTNKVWRLKTQRQRMCARDLQKQ